MRFLKQAIKTWAIYSVISFTLFQILWTIVDKWTISACYFNLDILLFDFIYCATYCLFVVGISYLVNKAFGTSLGKRKYFIMSAILVIILNLLVAIIFEYSINFLLFDGFSNDDFILKGFYVYSLVGICMSVITLLSKHYELLAEEHKKNNLLEMEVLKHQLDPHFLFNCLGTLEGLIDEKPEKAHEFVIKLSQIYRYIVQHFSDEQTCVCDAIKIVQDYTSLLETRHAGHFIVEIDKSLFSCHDYILPLSLQLLTENAIKHNKHSVANPLRILYLKEANYIVVRNSYNPNKICKESSGTGLINMKKRYELCGAGKCIINMTKTFFEVKIPIIKKYRP